MTYLETFKTISSNINSSKKNEGWRLISDKFSANLYLGIRDSCYGLRLQVSTNAIPKKLVDFNAKGIQFELSQNPKEPTQSRITLVATASGYNDIFVAICSDLAEHIGNLKEDSEIGGKFTDRLFVWQDFLKTFGHEGLGQNAQQGLFGELWVLNDQVKPTIGIADAIEHWHGPERQHHDFQTPRAAIEVKTTRGKQHVKISIQSERQLDSTGLDVLYLCHVSVIPTEAKGPTLKELVSKIRSLADKSGARTIFDAKLKKAGYLDIHDKNYLKTHYQIKKLDYYKVEGDFPRITTDSLPNGIGDTSYTIVASSLSAYVAEQKIATGSLKED